MTSSYVKDNCVEGGDIIFSFLVSLFFFDDHKEKEETILIELLVGFPAPRPREVIFPISFPKDLFIKIPLRANYSCVEMSDVTSAMSFKDKRISLCAEWIFLFLPSCSVIEILFIIFLNASKRILCYHQVLFYYKIVF